MTTSRKFADDEGTFNNDMPCNTPCRVCNKQTVTYKIWESSDGAYEDYKYMCKSCGARWWVDGIDS